MAHLQNRINAPGIDQALAFTNNGLAASPFTGSTKDGVLLWAAANEVQTGRTDAFTVANSATDGTTITVNQAGLYAVEFCVDVVASQTAMVLGISRNADGAALTGVLTYARGARALNTITTPAATVVGVAQSALIGCAPGDIIRFHANISGSAPTAGLTQASGYYRIQKAAELLGA